MFFKMLHMVNAGCMGIQTLDLALLAFILVPDQDLLALPAPFS